MVDQIGQALLNWYAIHSRDLPWRRSRDPYRIWVSEVMCQQTRVDTVIPYYERWCEAFPTIEHLAGAPEEQVLKAWEGLGYYSRARNLQSAAREVVATYGGEVPDDPDAFRSLKGVGPYTAGAVLSIAFNRAIPAVDGNVMRVLSRLFLITTDITLPATRRRMESLATELIPAGQARTFNQALMELGALVCTPTSPKCPACPVAEFCRARGEGRPDELPVKARAKAPRPVAVVSGVIWHQGLVLLVRRPSNGLLGGLWEFPGGEAPDGLQGPAALHRLMEQLFGFAIEVEAELIRLKHTFSHLVWDLTAYTAHLAPGAAVPAQSEHLRWVRPDELELFAFPVAHQKIARAVETCSAGGETLK